MCINLQHIMNGIKFITSDGGGWMIFHFSIVEVHFVFHSLNFIDFLNIL